MSVLATMIYTEYFDEENYTEFTTHEILLKSIERILKVFASRRCPERQYVKSQILKS